MRRTRAWRSAAAVLAAAAVLIVLLLYAGAVFHKAARVGSGYTAKILCSGVFVGGRTPESVRREELSWFSRFDSRIDRDSESVRADLYGLAGAEAIHRPGLGCTLLIGRSAEEIRAQAPNAAAVRDDAPPEGPWPLGNGGPIADLPPEIDPARLRAAVDAAFAEPDPQRLRRTRAVAVVYDGLLVAERYAPGFTAETPHQGWSMTKSVISALAGILVRAEKLSVEDRAPVPEWTGLGDLRSTITVDQLLRMSSGLQFEEDYENPVADAPFMLFGTGDVAGYAIGKPLEARPDEKWSYSSGTSNILARVLRDALGGSAADYLSFPRRALFDPIGMPSAVIEPDASGVFVGSSFMHATARDWARFGLLFLRDGEWYGRRILPEGWVRYSTTPAPLAPLGRYGAHWWLNAGEEGNPARRPMPSLPRDAFFALGFEGQSVTVIPSRRLVVVRLGLTQREEDWDDEGFIGGVLEAIRGSSQ